jgi:hypothetical protein
MIDIPAARSLLPNQMVTGTPVNGQPDLPALALGVVLAVGVCWPLAAGGRVFLLDWVIGPHASVLPESLFGLDGGVTAGVPLGLAVNAVSHLVGPAATWLLIAAFFPMATTAMSRLVGGSLWARLGAGTLYAVNPFVFQRLYAGQIALLLGYALLPFALRSMLHAVDAQGFRKLTPVLWMALLTAMSPHFAWICAVLLVAVVVCHRRRTAALVWAGEIALCFAASLAYVFLPGLGSSQVSSAQASGLAAFQTSGDPHIGIFGNVAALYGFWRVDPGPVLPKNTVSGWLFFLAALLVVMAVGVLATLRRPPTATGITGDGHRAGAITDGAYRRTLVCIVIVSAVLGFFLALGGQGPTGGLFRWAIDHVPWFDVMREPQKFSMLLALGYATCFGLGVERLAHPILEERGTIGRIGAVLLAVGLPLAYTPTIFGGLDGQIGPSQLPASWGRLQQTIDHRSGALLFLPWQAYLAFPFTNGRAIADPAQTSFSGEVISGTNVDLPGVPDTDSSPRSTFIQRVLTARGAAGPMGPLMAPLGVQYIALSKTVDWRSYGWLSVQPSLRLVFDSPTLELWENLAYAGIGRRGGADVTRLSPVAYRVPTGTPGPVTVAIPYQPGWSMDGAEARPTDDGVVSVRAGASAGVLRFDPWRRAELGDALSVGFLVALGIACGARRSRWRREPEMEMSAGEILPELGPEVP